METIKELKNTLDEKIKEAEQVFLVPHIKADFDAIASCIGMYLIVKKLGKNANIIIDEELKEMEPGVKIIVDEIKNFTLGKDKISIINSKKYKEIKSDNDLLITLDLNKSYLTSCKDYLDEFKSIIVIDHHNPDDKTIETEFKYIDVNLSSTSELLTELLCQYGIKYDKRIADYLLAGIYLDTDSLKRNVTSKTYKIMSKLLEKGADISRVNELFTYDFVSDRKVQNLIDKTQFLTYTFAIALADKDTIFSREELAKVADYLLKFRTDASFAIGYISEEEISISARAIKDTIDVGEVMKELGGGGSPFSAATKITGQNIDEVEKALTRTLKPKTYVKE